MKTETESMATKLEYSEVDLHSGARVLVTGAAGFIGLHLAKVLSANPALNLILVDNFSRGPKDDAFSSLGLLENVSIQDADISTQSVSLPDVDYVFHLASINGTRNFYERPFDVTEAAILPTLSLVSRYRGCGQLKKFVLTSTSEVYAGAVEFGLAGIPTPEGVPAVVSDQMNPRWSYAAGKIAAEQAVLGAWSQFNFPGAVLRYHNVYGPRMGEDHVIPQLIRRFRSGDYRVFGGVNSRSFIFVDDAVEATIAIASSNEATGNIFHVGTEREIKIQDLGQLILKLMNIKASLIIEDAPPGSVSRRAPDTARLQSEIGFQPKVSLEEGLVRVIESYL